MGRKVKSFKNYTTEQIKEFIDNADNADKYKLGIRLCALYQLSKGKPSRELEEFYNVSFKQILNWADRLENEGLAGLRDKPRSGRPKKLTGEQLSYLRSSLLESPEESGYNTGCWSGPVVCDYILKTFGVEYRTGVYSLLSSMGFSYQKARGFYPERDEQVREEAKTDIKKL
jgi:transposase